jgi:isochorismate hydrolase
MERVRKAGLTVAYGTREQDRSKWLKDVVPNPTDIKVINTAQDRFYNTDLDKALKAKGIPQASALSPQCLKPADRPLRKW